MCQKGFLDFIIATLIKFAKADHHFDDKVIEFINKVTDVFNKDKNKKNFFQIVKEKIRIGNNQ